MTTLKKIYCTDYLKEVGYYKPKQYSTLAFYDFFCKNSAKKRSD